MLQVRTPTHLFFSWFDPIDIDVVISSVKLDDYIYTSLFRQAAAQVNN